MTKEMNTDALPKEIRKHEIKILPEYFSAHRCGLKTFEIRKNDSDYQVVDVVVLKEWEIRGHFYTGAEITGVISYITDYEQQDGYVVFGFNKSHTDLVEQKKSLEMHVDGSYYDERKITPQVPTKSPQNEGAFEALARLVEYAEFSEELDVVEKEEETIRQALTAPRPARHTSHQKVDVESLKKPELNKHKHPSKENRGWNACLDHLKEKGII